MRPGKRPLLLAAALLAGCACSGSAQTTFRFQFKEKERLNYLIEQKTNSVQKIMGVEVVSKVHATMKMYWEVVKVDGDGNAQVRIKFTHAKMSMESLLGIIDVDSNDKGNPADLAGKMIGQLNRAIANMEITATMLPTGEMKNILVSEATARALKAIPNAEQLGDVAHPDNFKDMLSSVVFPALAVARGKSWSFKTDSQSPEGKVSTEHSFTLEDSVHQDGVKLDRIALAPSIKIQPDPKALLKVEKIMSTGHLLFDNKLGRLVSSSIVQTKLGKIEVMGITLDSKSEVATNMRLTGLTAEEKLEAAGKVEAVKINEDEFVDRMVATEQLETIAGVARSFTVSRSFEPAIIMDGPLPVSDDLKNKVGAALDISIGKKTMVKETVTLDGKEVTKLNVLWMERYRRGTAVASDGSRLTFLVRVGLQFKLEKAK